MMCLTNKREGCEEDRNAYATLKQNLASKFTDGMEYCKAKTKFINGIIDKALKEKSLSNEEE